MKNIFTFLHSFKQIYLFLIIITVFIGCNRNNNENPGLTDITSPNNNQITYEYSQERYYYAVVNANGLRIREQPSLDSNIIGQLNQGMSVNILGRSLYIMFLDGNHSYWYKINYDNIEGWVYGTYIDLNDIQSAPLPILSTDLTYTHFTREFVEKAITEPILVDGNTILFSESNSSGMRIISGGVVLYDSDYNFFYNSDTLYRHIGYENYIILLVTQKIDGIEYVRDFLMIEKQTPETYFFRTVNGIEINGELTGLELSVVIYRPWLGIYTEDISQAL